MLRVLDIFSGVGGLSYGFANDGNFEIVVANEISPTIAEAYSLNHPKVKMYCCDIRDFTAEQVLEDTGISSDSIDIVIGGPPCQSYSTIGKRLLDDPRGKMFQEYYRVLQEFNPSVFLFENVRGLMSMRGGELLQDIVRLFESLGYHIQYRLLNAADYGVPQIRERVFIVGSKLPNEFEYPAPTHYNLDESRMFSRGKSPYLTIKEAIGDLPFIRTGESSGEYSSTPQNDYQRKMREDAPLELQDHNAPNNGINLVKIMEALPDGGTPADIPEAIRPKSGYANTYCRLWWDRPSTTITRNLGTPSSSRCVHPKAPRALTTREGARLQSFPDSYQFYGSRGDRNLQIGNSVPPFLSSVMARQVREHYNDYAELSKPIVILNRKEVRV